MAQFLAINPNVEVNGECILSLAKGLGAFQALGFDILSKYGIKNPKPEDWFKQQLYLDSFKGIFEKFGPATLWQIGKSIPENVQFPPEIDNIHKALAAIDVAFHMNHRLNGVSLFNPANGKMTEGIGHYHYKKIHENKAELECDNSYPCDFDRGIIEAMARKFQPSGSLIKLEHDKARGCRSAGGRACTYSVSW